MPKVTAGWSWYLNPFIPSLFTLELSTTLRGGGSVLSVGRQAKSSMAPDPPELQRVAGFISNYRGHAGLWAQSGLGGPVGWTLAPSVVSVRLP